jgi:hypothetical protein
MPDHVLFAEGPIRTLRQWDIGMMGARLDRKGRRDSASALANLAETSRVEAGRKLPRGWWWSLGGREDYFAGNTLISRELSGV